ncbi:MAG: pyruvate kinase [Dehalococcoidia bacterium]|nr:pyruvate kinase [Dehalococcoidia bacterium]
MTSFRRTKIVATLGPATDDEAVLRRLLESGVDVVRLNFSHEDRAAHGRRIALVRRIASELGRVVAVMQDLQGPRIRVGEMAGGKPVRLKAGERLDISARPVEGTESVISTSYEKLPQVVRPGDPVLLNDGLLQLRVTAVHSDRVETVVVQGGVLSARKGVNLPQSTIDAPALTAKDRDDLRFGLEQGVDMVALSFVRRPRDADPARRLMRERGARVPLLAKIERPEALDALDGILGAFDGVMVARGDLAIEVSPEKVPVEQKRIIERANIVGKAVITATQMLESMTRNPTPTRAEASDVANAVLDGSDAVMLSAETSIGRYPVLAVQAMDRIIRQAETLPVSAPVSRRRGRGHAVARAAATLAVEVDARALAAYTRSGRTARTLSKLLPPLPIFALTDREAMARQLALWRGVYPLFVEGTEHIEEVTAEIDRELGRRQLLAPGDLVVIVGAAPQAPAGETNFIRLVAIS